MRKPDEDFFDSHYITSYSEQIGNTENSAVSVEFSWGTEQERPRSSPKTFGMSISMTTGNEFGSALAIWYPTRENLVKLIDLATEMSESYDEWNKEKGQGKS